MIGLVVSIVIGFGPATAVVLLGEAGYTFPGWVVLISVLLMFAGFVSAIIYGEAMDPGEIDFELETDEE